MIPGIKVDTGAKPLRRISRRDHHRGAGRPARAARRVLQAGGAVREMARGHRHRIRHPDVHTRSRRTPALARYAALCQEAGIVPIVEPEVLMDGGHTLARCEEVTNAVLDRVFSTPVRRPGAAGGHGAQAEHGDRRARSAPRNAAPEQVAEATLRTLKRHVPAAVPGIAFLSGGQSPTEATLHLSLMNAARAAAVGADVQLRPRAAGRSRCTPGAASAASFAAGQKAFSMRAKLNGLAAAGTYNAGDGKRRGVNGPSDRAAAALRGAEHRSARPLNHDPAIVEIRDLGYAVSGRRDFRRPRHGYRARARSPRSWDRADRQDDAAAADHRQPRRRRARCVVAGEDMRDVDARRAVRAAPAHGHAVPERRAAHRS